MSPSTPRSLEKVEKKPKGNQMTRVLESRERVQTTKLEVFMQTVEEFTGTKKGSDTTTPNIRSKRDFSQGST